jgi:hypothetical protein
VFVRLLGEGGRHNPGKIQGVRMDSALHTVQLIQKHTNMEKTTSLAMRELMRRTTTANNNSIRQHI